MKLDSNRIFISDNDAVIEAKSTLPRYFILSPYLHLFDEVRQRFKVRLRPYTGRNVEGDSFCIQIADISLPFDPWSDRLCAFVVMNSVSTGFL